MAADERCHDLCPNCGKVRFTSRQQALIAAAKQGHRNSARAYRCGRYWHLTSWSAEVYEARQEYR